VQTNVHIVKSLLLEEIERIVAEAKQANDPVSAGYHAGHLLRAYPQSGLSLGRIINEITAMAAASKVPVENSRPVASFELVHGNPARPKASKDRTRAAASAAMITISSTAF